MARGFLGLKGREERQAKRRIRRELQDLRSENRGMSKKEFRKFALKTFEERYEGIDISKLEEILQLILKYLPMILALFAMLLISLMVPLQTQATEFTVFAAATSPEPAVYETSEDGYPIPLEAWTTEEVAADTATVTTTTTTTTVESVSSGSCGAMTGPVRNLAAGIRERQPVRGLFRAVRNRSFLKLRGNGCG